MTDFRQALVFLQQLVSMKLSMCQNVIMYLQLRQDLEFRKEYPFPQDSIALSQAQQNI